jgi:hypothetical protein
MISKYPVHGNEDFLGEKVYDEALADKVLATFMDHINEFVTELGIPSVRQLIILMHSIVLSRIYQHTYFPRQP